MNSQTPEDYQANLEHAKAAYANAQEVVRFVDSKTGILTGILTVTTALPFALLNLLMSSESESAQGIVKWFMGCGLLLKASILGSMGVGIGVGCLSLLNSTSGLMSRMPSIKHKDEHIICELLKFVKLKFSRFVLCKDQAISDPYRLSCLFPLFPPTRDPQATELFQRLQEGKLKPIEILSEYGAQLKSLGIILHAKIERNKDAVRWFEIQILFYALCALLALFVFLYAKPTPTEEGKKEHVTQASGKNVGATSTIHR